MALLNTFRSKAAAPVMAFAMALSPAAFANDANTAQETTIQTVALKSTDVEVLPDAQSPANAWVHGNPDRIAISVSLGDANRGEMISNLPVVMDYQFAQRGKTGVEYFWEDGGAGATVFVIHSDAYVAEPLTFVDPAKVVSAIDKVVKLSNSKSTDFASALDVSYD